MFTKIKKTIAFFLIAGLGGYAGSYVFNHYEQNIAAISTKNHYIQTLQPVATGHFASMAANENAPDLVKAAEGSVHAVVHVKIYGTPSYNPFQDPFGGFFGQPQRQQQQQQQ